MPTLIATTPAVEISGLNFGYEPNRPVVQDCTAKLEPGKLCALIGPNAAGKSTLLRLILGQLAPWSGTACLSGQNAQSMTFAQRAAIASFVPQRSRISFAFSVRQVVEMGRFAVGPNHAAVRHALEQCDLLEVTERPYNHLSVGQQQRVALARAMAQSAGPDFSLPQVQDPPIGGAGAGEGGNGMQQSRHRVILLDEPVSAMDLWHVHHTMQLLTDLAKSGLAVLVVLHDLNLAARYADEVWLMDKGRIVTSGPWRQILRPDVLQPVYRVGMRMVDDEETGRPIFLVRADAGV